MCFELNVKVHNRLLVSGGREFQSLGAMTEKVLLSRDVRTYGMDRTDESDDLIDVIFISESETSVEFVIFFQFLQPHPLEIHLSPANLTTVINSTLASHKQILTNFNAFKTH
jgi:hypothetical protein